MEEDRIFRLVNIVAPRSWGDAALKSLVFMLLINAMDILVLSVSGNMQLSLMGEITIATTIALPFVIFIMGILYHQRRLQSRLLILATTDMLTGLSNRRHFLDRARAALRQDKEGVLLVLDADHFKRINDRWGHSAGDACLIAIGRHLRTTLRAEDILGRLGGEEFAAFLPRVGTEHALQLAEQLCRPIVIAVGEVPSGLSVTLSVGLAPVREGVSLDHLLAQADFALYRAKAAGRARMEIWAEQGSRDWAA